MLQLVSTANETFDRDAEAPGSYKYTSQRVNLTVIISAILLLRTSDMQGQKWGLTVGYSRQYPGHYRLFFFKIFSQSVENNQ